MFSLNPQNTTRNVIDAHFTYEIQKTQVQNQAGQARRQQSQDVNSGLLGTRVLVVSTLCYTVKSNLQPHHGPHKVKGFLALRLTHKMGFLVGKDGKRGQ